MTRFHWLRLRATSHATEVPERVEQAMRFVAAEPELAIGRTRMESHHGGEVWALEGALKRAADIRRALAPMLDAQPDLAAEVEARTDDDGVFYLRFEKQAAFEGRLVPTRGSDAVQVRLKPEVHPAGRERAVAALAAWLGTA